MGANPVVVQTPSLDQHLGFLEAVEDLSIEQLVPKLCSVTPRERQTFPTVWPCAKATSASRSFPMICSTVCFFFAIPSSSKAVQL